MDDFNSIRLKRKTLQEFKEYSLKTSPNYSETLGFMIAFFKDTGISPYDTIRNPILLSTVGIIRRLDYTIALLKNIEKTQLIPTREMLESLFQKKPGKEKPVLVEKKLLKESKLITEDPALTFYREGYNKLQKRHNTLRNEIKCFVAKISYEKRSFGKYYFKLNLNKNEFDNFINENNI